MQILGIDEVGRGPWAGPLVAGAVVLREPVEGLRDSKKLTKKRRDSLDIEIRAKAWVGLGWVTASEIDAMGISRAVKLAMLRAVKDLHAAGGLYEEIIIDGNINYFKNVLGFQTNQIRAVIKADSSFPVVSAASIVAKVARDAYMAQSAATYPEYGFEKHVGYGTMVHAAALRQHGVTPEHRKSFKPVQEVMI